MWSAQRHNPLILDGLHLYQHFWQVICGFWFWVLSVNRRVDLLVLNLQLLLASPFYFLLGPFIAFHCKVCES